MPRTPINNETVASACLAVLPVLLADAEVCGADVLAVYLREALAQAEKLLGVAPGEHT